MDFKTTAINVLLLVAMAIPGFLLMKAKVVKPKGIAYFSAVLLYVSQPFLSLRSFLKVGYDLTLLKNLGIVFAFSMLAQLLIFVTLWLILRKWFDKPEETQMLIDNGFLYGNSLTNEPELLDRIRFTKRGRAYRAMILTSTFGNVGFFGVPVLEFMFPDYPEAIAYSAVFIVSMNLMCWTIGSYVLTGDKKYVKFKKAILNPQTLILFLALPLFFGGVTMNSLPDALQKVINLFADMTAPLCMLILGMRFALAPVVELFTDWKYYVSTLVKNLLFPMLSIAVLLPFAVYKLLDPMVYVTLVVLSGMPSASINLNLAELYGADQKTAANTILLSTFFCILTIPIAMELARISIGM